MNVVTKTIKLLEENVGIKLLDIGLGIYFLDLIAKTKDTKAKIKLKSFCKIQDGDEVGGSYIHLLLEPNWNCN